MCLKKKENYTCGRLVLNKTKFNSLYFSIRIIPPQLPFYIKQKSLLNYYEQKIFQHLLLLSFFEAPKQKILDAQINQ